MTSSQPLLNTPDRHAKTKLEGGQRFVMHTEFEPAGDQPTAIRDLVQGIKDGDQNQVLLGATGTGKTYTMAKVIERTQRPAIILAPNKTLAAQLYAEFNTMTTTSPRPTCRARTPISRRKARSTNRSTACATRRRGRFWSVTM
jgi:superfamily II DNA or RNA helicase